MSNDIWTWTPTVTGTRTLSESTTSEIRAHLKAVKWNLLYEPSTSCAQCPVAQPKMGYDRAGFNIRNIIEYLLGFLDKYINLIFF